MQYNNRERLHKDLDTIIDAAEKAGHRLIFTGTDSLDMNLREATKKNPGGIRFKAGVGVSLESFAPEYRDSLKHLYDRSGRLDMNLLLLLGIPARTLVDFEEVKAEQEAAAAATATSG